MSTQSFIFDHALLPSGWGRDVRVDVADGAIIKVAAGAARDGAERIAGIALPGMPNVHCHAFQKGMAGLSERRGPRGDDFWTWREVMYRFLAALNPDDVEAIAAFAYMEMLEAGYTAVGEFHYLHHDIDGRPYADIGEMAARIAAAANETRIGLTLLPCFYANGGFGGAPPTEGQRRFINDPERFAKLVARVRQIAAGVPDAQVGVAPHSLRAVTPASLNTVVMSAEESRVHIHSAEFTAEVHQFEAMFGARPVEWLLDHAGVGPNWCLVHATHMTEDETRRLAKSGAVVGLCPLTEANLGDGIFNGVNYLAAGGRFAIGTDSNIEIDAAAELRQLEYSQRLKHRSRNVLAAEEGQSTGLRLYADALAGGAQALGRSIGSIASGKRADIVLLDAEHPDLAGTSKNTWLDAYVFVAGRRLVKTVIAGGEKMVEDGRHRLHDAIAGRYRKVLSHLAAI